MIRKSKAKLAAAVAIALISAPAMAQQMTSDSFAFLEAVKKRDGTKATDFLAAPGSTIVNTRERASGDTALHIVTRERDLNWLGFLIGKGAKVDSENREGNTPLLIAAQIGWGDGARALLSKRASVDKANGRGETPLIHAVLKRDVAMVRLLLGAGANPKRADSTTGYSALDYARRDPRAASIVKLLEEPAKPAKTAFGPTL